MQRTEDSALQQLQLAEPFSSTRFSLVLKNRRNRPQRFPHFKAEAERSTSWWGCFHRLAPGSANVEFILPDNINHSQECIPTGENSIYCRRFQRSWKQDDDLWNARCFRPAFIECTLHDWIRAALLLWLFNIFTVITSLRGFSCRLIEIFSYLAALVLPFPEPLLVNMFGFLFVELN